MDKVYAVDIVVSRPANIVKITNFGTMLGAVLGFVFILAALAAFIYLIWGGVAWITSGGDKGKTEEARNRIQAAILGLFIVFATWAVFSIISQFLLGQNILEGIKIPSPF
jgi:hypothetical protein